MNNITRHKRNSEIVTGKILVVCKVTIEGLGTHSEPANSGRMKRTQ